ncbi:uncharacterized protein H6S33_001944 [Morchella sextelata]|uniref:uncharacterized protein n=1 Tax=Morchella sextelata TaxID=1174677 RepID=UPI001D05A185|nr:uncharacterized protein H6S33_001944 [Morchella sextelata]KAH0607892.1 hypothetical protein H6S33_001944 [Morchella sextelata]
MFKSHPWVVKTLSYALVPLNLALLTLIILITHAYIHPTTSAPSYYLRSHGQHTFTILTICTITGSALIGILNALVIHHHITSRPRRYDSFKRTLTIHLPRLRLRTHYIVAALLLAVSAAYLLIAALAFREPFQKMAWAGACSGYALMAEVEVLPGWYDGGNGSVFGASSRVRYWKDGEEVGVMELVRHYRMEPGFNLYRKGAPERERFDTLAGWGMLDMRLVVGEGAGRYWGGGNGTGNGTVGSGGNGTVAARGRVGEVKLDLKTSTYDATYTNTTHPHLRGSYDILPKNLTFPGLHLLHAQPGEEWRFTDHVCLPPRISLGDPDRQTKEDIHGELSDDCTKYRLCALKRAYPNSEKRADGSKELAGGEGEGWQEWWAWVEDVWPIVTGVVAWEVEKYSACCVRNE